MGKIVRKSAEELEKMRAAGLIVSRTLAATRDAVRPGVSTWDLDRLARNLIERHGGAPSFLGYQGYPASICASVNDEVVHGIPKRERVLEPGDLVKLDVGVCLDGFHADSAVTVPVGEVSEELQRLLRVTRESLWAGIRAIRWRGRLQDVSRAIQRHVERNGFSVVREMFGHGVGRHLHEEPQIPNFTTLWKPNPRLDEGMTLAIEPMVNAGRPDVVTLPDKWTVVTKDRSLSAHFEHTVAVTREGYDVLTLGPHDPGE